MQDWMWWGVVGLLFVVFARVVGLKGLVLVVGSGALMGWLFTKPPMASVYWGLVVLVVAGLVMARDLLDEELAGVSFFVGLILIGMGLIRRYGILRFERRIAEIVEAVQEVLYTMFWATH